MSIIRQFLRLWQHRIWWLIKNVGAVPRACPVSPYRFISFVGGVVVTVGARCASAGEIGATFPGARRRADGHDRAPSQFWVGSEGLSRPGNGSPMLAETSF